MMLNRRDTWILLGILLIAFALRVYHLEQRSIWYDEAFSVLLAEQNPVMILQGTAADVQPPLYYQILGIWRMLGESLFAMRFLSVTFSVLSVVMAYRIARLLGLPRVAMYAMALVAIAPFQIAYAQELRMYSLLVFAFSVYFFAFLKLAQGDARWHAVLVMGISGAVALYSQSIALFTWLVPDVYISFNRDGRLLKRLIGGQVISLMLFAPWLGVLASQWTNVQHAYWTTRPGLVEVIQLLLAFTTYQPLPTWLLPIALFLSLAVCSFLIFELGRIRNPSSTLILIALGTLIPPLLMIVLSYIIRPVFIVRAAIFSALAFSIWMAWWLTRLRSEWFRRVIGIVWVALVAVSLAFQSSYDGFPRVPFQAADAYLDAHMQSTDVIVHDNKLSYLPMHFYDRSLPQLWLADPVGAGSDTLSLETMRVLQISPTDLNAAINGHARVWFIIFQTAIDEAEREGHSPGNLAVLDARMNRVDATSFGDLRIIRYEAR